jgi:predicted dehydrogenase
MPHKSFRVGIAGLGYGTAVQVQAFKELGCEVVGIAGTSLRKAKEVAKSLQIPHAYDQFEDLFDLKLNLISIAIPPVVGENALEFALNNRIPVLAEKPLASNFEMATRLAQIAKESDIPNAVDFQFCELNAFKEAKKLLSKGTFGKLKEVNLNWSKMNFVQKNNIWGWKTDLKQGGGVLNLLAAHFFYILEDLTEPVKEIKAELSSKHTDEFTPAGKTAAEDTAELDVVLKSGVNVTATISNADPKNNGHHWEFICEKGTIYLDNPSSDYMRGFNVSSDKGNTGKKKIVFEDNSSSGVDGRILAFKDLADRFIHSIKDETSFSPDFDAGARIQKMLDACRVSDEDCSIVTISK